MGTDNENTDAGVQALENEAPVVVPTPPAELDAGKKKALIIVGNHTFPKDGKQLVIVVESRTPDASGVPEHKKTGYPTGADIYYRTDPETSFPKSADDKAEVITLGYEVQQFGFWGFSTHPELVSVGPAHPAFAAANIAWQRGATDITIVGLSQSERDLIQPYIDDLPTNTLAPAQVKVSLT